MDAFSTLLQASVSAGRVSNGTPFLPSISFETLFTKLINLFLDVGSSDYEQKLATVLFGIKFFAVFLSLLFIAGTIFSRMRTAELEHKRHKRFAPKVRAEKVFGSTNSTNSPNSPEAEEAKKKAIQGERWARILGHAGSASENDWRLAILEADIVLDDMLKAMGAFGDTLGERLKSTNVDMLPSLQKAWEAHLVRNQIAHQGASFQLSQHEARRVIGLYEAVLRDGRFI